MTTEWISEIEDKHEETIQNILANNNKYQRIQKT